MSSKKAWLDHLRNVALFSACSTRDLQKIARAGDEVSLPAGALVVDQGQTGREAFVLLDGSAVVRRNGKKITMLGPGDVIGELSLLDHGPRTASVTCETDCLLLVLDQRNFVGVLDEVPALAHKMLAHLAGRIRELDRQYYG
jgi:CRP/FNR family transcriptional regulator, cyclic AMP receptor protein